MKGQEELVREVEDNWSGVIHLLKELRDAWEVHRKHYLWCKDCGISLDGLDPDLQRDLAQTFARSEFEKALPQLTNYYRRAGGISKLWTKALKREAE